MLIEFFSLDQKKKNVSEMLFEKFVPVLVH